MSAAKRTRRGSGRQVSPTGRGFASCVLAVILCLLAPPSMAWAVDVLFVGDSLTAGYYATSEPQSFRALTGAWFASDGYPTSTNLAVPGGKIADAATETAQISDAGADVAVIELGTNDASGYPTWQPTPADEFEADYRSVLEAVRSARPQARLVLLGVWKEKADRDIYDGIIAALATEYDGCYVNLETLSDDPSLSGPAGRATYNGTSDTFHPNDAGHQAIAAAVEQAFSWQGGIVLDDGAPATNDPAVQVSAAPVDQFSDISQMRLTTDLSAWPDWQSFTSPSVLTLPTGDGPHTVYAQFRDQLGSLTPVVAGTIVLDTVPPTTTCTGDHRWHRRPVRLVLTAVDATSGVAETMHRMDGGPWVVGTSFAVPAPRDHSRDGTHVVEFFSTDQAGNTESVHQTQVRIDTRGPLTHAPDAVSTRRGRWTRLPLRVHDALSTTATIWVRIVNANKRRVLVLGPCTMPVNRQKRIGFKCHLRPGSYQFDVLARDQAGNRQAKTGRNSLTVR